ncbi:polysaccharide export outer membrane protein [Anaerospora hongkongensis]|uniref:Polysaccharide export outer membrane protein n=1 Tax=Anaerospora hongkongensis TaxID=244830 RepID=A0A4R1Q508_9FIRM|nr:polysaccharide biosynthesis/export family protein [Anaerospora hongkongensis]TCL36061.1 polysaccharide export outer membrane protein [Anaerospora hongkongensis]
MLCKFMTFFVMMIMLVCPVFAEDYKLGPGDVLTINVWGYEKLEVKELTVRPDGKISFPMAGDVQAQGKSVFEVTEELTASLGKYLKDPQVAVNVLKFRTTRVYVLGKVNKPGMYEIEKQHNLLDAIGMAGSYTDEAAKKKIFIIHKDTTKKTTKANLLNLLNKGDMTQNYVLADGDVVYLADNGRIDFMKDIIPFIGAAYQVNDIKKD